VWEQLEELDIDYRVGWDGDDVQFGGTSSNTASAPGVTKDTIKIGFITSVTGNASSTFFNSAIGAKAAFDAINAGWRC
jgi:ABC-type branched-subunit amino acid transport system substrate-binding protein